MRSSRITRAARNSPGRKGFCTSRAPHSQPRARCRCAASGDLRINVDAGGSGPPVPPSDEDYSSGDDGSGDSENLTNVAVMLAATGRSVSSLPADMQTAAVNGRLSPAVLQKYLDLESNWFFNIFLPMQGFRERLMADPSFFVKMGIECGIGIGTKCAAERGKRGENFSKELDFVTANVIMAIIADFMLVWLPAPTLAFNKSRQGAQAKNAISRFFATCPDNAFQKVPVGFEPWTLKQRLAAPVRNGAKLLAVGFCASMLGVVITNSLIFIRKQFDASFETNKAQNPLVMSGAYATYMASSSNFRYQFLAGVIEERGIETLFAGKHNICHTLSFVLRTANTFLGSLMWVDYIRLLGLQPKLPPKEES